MQHLKRLTFGAMLSIFSVQLLAAQSPITDDQKHTATQLMQTAIKSDLGMEIVTSLTTEIGPRLGGSEAEKRARDWGLKLGQDLGFDKAWIEEFTMPFWDRGHLHISLTSPYQQDLYGTALGGAAPTKESINADVVYFRDIHALKAVKDNSLNGKIAFVDGDMMVKSQTGAGYGQANQRRRIGWQHAERGGASALVVRSVGSDSHRFPHSGMMSSEGDKWANIPVIAISNPDADHLRRLHNLDKPLTISLHSESKWKGDVSSGNVILDLVGSEKPEEIVLIGGHLDSWDLGTGAVDDGAGIAITTAAAALIAKLPKRPKRTIRVVMFGAEEVGLLGAFAYAKQHEANLKNHVVATESDFGAQTIWQLVSNVNPKATVLMDDIAKILSPLGIIRGGSDVPGGGPDIIPLAAKGVPTIRLSQNGRDYFDLHHTPDDTLDKINPDELAQNIAAYAASIYLIADSDVELKP
ncbi:M20/M25/M40 family metallo-hydrolase [Thalassotalea sp. 1_MG-2023]|uniref:M20/M25/M40 family metallo-hydrolase n=1 Tax=Thalassotalea sp. 1_MG-2023 TaxID=3062680 RepID=UPI0026E40EE5|nr:M20/M25/M40 family metallo-hydrolase [Thalassotalea sp. 1_MG-2023]MDO6426695.1 M20/M25/M40 family metallo-hydrolase [Thalassotalea sp. 1_MG-2023]